MSVCYKLFIHLIQHNCRSKVVLAWCYFVFYRYIFCVVFVDLKLWYVYVIFNLYYFETSWPRWNSRVRWSRWRASVHRWKLRSWLLPNTPSRKCILSSKSQPISRMNSTESTMATGTPSWAETSGHTSLTKPTTTSTSTSDSTVSSCSKLWRADDDVYCLILIRLI